MSALASLYVQPQEQLLHDLLEIKGPPGGGHRANEEYHALLAIQQMVNYLDMDIRPKYVIKDQLKSRQWAYKMGVGKIRNAVIESVLSKLEDI